MVGGKKVRSRASHGSVAASSPGQRPSDAGLQPPARPGCDELQQMTKDQLRAECRRRGQKTNGNKTELLQRLTGKMTTKRKEQSNNGSIGGGAGGDLQCEKVRKKGERGEREALVIWKQPLKTFEYSIKELFVLLTIYGKKVLDNRKLVLFGVVTLITAYLIINTTGPHQSYVHVIYKKLLWCSYWIGLGILSSVGLGTGLHTFLLYLGPHIAAVTLAAYECASLDFPAPPYPDEIVCPTNGGGAPNATFGAGGSTLAAILAIMGKVRLEAMCWGAGTALGELPPYFMARAARLSGCDPDDEADEEMAEFEELKRKSSSDLTFIERGKLFVEDLVQKVGFLGILACASIPNPLFDLAGITCGHFLVPFWTFFGATLIGKAIIKMHIQKMFVIIAFNETLIEMALDWLNLVPVIGDKLQVPFRMFLNGQKQRLHKSGVGGGENGKSGGGESGGGNLFGAIFEKFVFAMIFYFVISIVNSFAQSYHKRLCKKSRKAKIARD